MEILIGRPHGLSLNLTKMFWSSFLYWHNRKQCDDPSGCRGFERMRTISFAVQSTKGQLLTRCIAIVLLHVSLHAPMESRVCCPVLSHDG